MQTVNLIDIKFSRNHTFNNLDFTLSELENKSRDGYHHLAASKKISDIIKKRDRYTETFRLVQKDKRLPNPKILGSKLTATWIEKFGHHEDWRKAGKSWFP